MKILLIVILFLVLFVFSLKQTFGSRRQLFVWALVCALATVWSGNIAITVSKTDFAAWLADKNLMKDIAVLVSLEVIANIAFCVTTVILDNSLQGNKKLKIINTILKWFPGVCIFPTLFYMLAVTIYAFPGVDFDVMRYVFGALILVALPLASWIVKLVLPEKEIRTEVLFISSAVLAMAATLLSMN